MQGLLVTVSQPFNDNNVDTVLNPTCETVIYSLFALYRN